ncbi:FHA domain-containing protein [Streptomyces sp. NBRC 110611]|uniref:condensation domain-containing protein n=1 Tax=Streptomyces sp. NBRC 110611 TaxID=1621259 RepID=UPI0008336920|nr:condensation domain-containing protein [Streptomyces sp. NBRC 110611]GAU70351.1 FHA domain-containing protein [Streptomyces sp. NBRC 110611]
MPADPAMPDAVATLARIWQEILDVPRVGPDDDFFALGGDSLLALEIIGAAEEQGLSLTLLDLFKNPTPRGACTALTTSGGPGAAASALVSPLDRARVPDDVEAACPAAHLQLGLIYESLMSEGRCYIDVISRTLNRPLRPDVLRRTLDLLAQRHPVLRTRFDLATFSEPLQLVEPAAPIPLEISDDQADDQATAAERHEELMRRLAEPYDPERAPLLRAHAAATGPRTFRFSYSFHHAILDGWSEAVFFSELARTYAALWSGSRPDLPEPAPYATFVRLEREALQDAAALRYLTRLWTAPGGAPQGVPAARSEAALPGPSTASSEAEAPPGPSTAARTTATAALPQAHTQRLTQLSAQWRVPVKSLLLTACCAAAGAVWGTDTPTVGLVTNGRPEVPGAALTLGLFLNRLPFRLGLSGATWQAAARRALAEENGLLPYRRFPYAELRRLLGPDPFLVNFNYVHFHPRAELVAAGLVTAEEDMRDHTSLPVSVDALNGLPGDGLTLVVTADTSRFGPHLPARLLEHVLHAVAGLVTHPEAAAVAPRSG